MIPVRDRDQGREFYGEKLGFRVQMEDPEVGIWFDAGGGTRFFVYESVGAGESRHTLASFVVDDLDGALGELRGSGVMLEEYDMPGLKTQEGVATIGATRTAWFKDPDGNIIAVTEEPAV